jgi:hypothetical protein
MAVTTYALEDHLTSVVPFKDARWLWLEAMILRWLYGSMAPDIIDLVMIGVALCCAVFSSVCQVLRHRASLLS